MLHEGHFDVVGFEEVALEFFGFCCFDGDADHLAQEFVADGAKWLSAEEFAEAFCILLNELAAGSGNGRPVVLLQKFNGFWYG